MPRVKTKRGVNWGTRTIHTEKGDVSYMVESRTERSQEWRKARNDRRKARKAIVNS